jgi:hypothetical protein
MQIFIRTISFLIGLSLIIATLQSAISTFILPRNARSLLNRILFKILRQVFEKVMRFAKTFDAKEAIFAYYAPIGLLMLIPSWYALMTLGYGAIYWSLGFGDFFTSIRLSGSSLLTLGFATSNNIIITLLIFSEATIGLMLVALLIAYLPTMYAAFSSREEFVNLLEVRAGTPPSSVEMLKRFNRIHGIEHMDDYWQAWETWFAQIEESHSTLAALVFFRSPRSDLSWITAAGTVLDAAALRLAALEMPPSPEAMLCIRAGFLAFRRISDSFGVPYPPDPIFPETPINITQADFDAVLETLAEEGIALKEDREQAWKDFAGWRVNYDHTLLALCDLVMAPPAFWSSSIERS